MLRLLESQYATIVGHCYAEFPLEACGLFLGLRYSQSDQPEPNHISQTSEAEVF